MRCDRGRERGAHAHFYAAHLRNEAKLMKTSALGCAWHASTTVPYTGMSFSAVP